VKQPPLDFIVVSAAENGEALLGLVCMKRPPLDFVVVSAAEYREALLGLICVKQPPLDFIVVSAAEHGEALLGSVAGSNYLSTPSLSSPNTMELALSSTSTPCLPFIYRHRFSRMVDGGKVL
jgi:hypothetical protein